MSPNSKNEYTQAVAKRYKRADIFKKSVILNEYCNVTGYHRKHAIRKLNNCTFFINRKLKKRGKPSRYNNQDILIPLKKIWLTANLPCSKRLKVILPLWLPSYQKEFGYLPEYVLNALDSISSPTIDRLLKPSRIKYKGRGRSTTKPGTLLRKHIPIKTNQWDEFRPGFLEADTVAHCGDTTDGIYANTIDFVDIATCWTEQRAVWGKGEQGVLKEIRNVEKDLPFPILGFDSDNGNEFLNWHLFRHFTQRKQPVQFTRSRAYHKDDNAHIEQKNWTHVRQWLGYHRFDDPLIVPLMNELYTSEWRFYHNFFCPSTKLLEKKRVASKVIKKYDAPKTPFQRILDSEYVNPKVKQKLKEQFDNLNPFQLRKAMELKINKIFKLTSKLKNTKPSYE
ncbi:MAG: integrase [Candidatus Omnitrophota bacterium]